MAASETYNTALEQHHHGNLGVRFAERPGTDPTKRPIREFVLAVKDGRLARNVGEGISLPQVVTGEHRYLTHAGAR